MKTDTTISFMDDLIDPTTKSSVRKTVVESTRKKTDYRPTAQAVERDNLARGYTYVEGLLYKESEGFKLKGTCGPNNICTYEYLTGDIALREATKKLNSIADNNTIFAIDFETGPAKIAPIDPETGLFIKEKLKASTLGVKTGSDPHSSTVFLMAISTEKNHSWVVDIREARLDANFIKALGRAAMYGRPIAHNFSFEWVYLYALTGCKATCYFCTMVATQVLYAGAHEPLEKWIDPEKKPPRVRASLGAVLLREEGLSMDKTEQTSFLSLHEKCGLTQNQIGYVAGDTGLLLALTEKLRGKLKSKNLLHIWDDIEAKFLPILAENNYYGCPIDVDMTILFRDECLEQIDKFKKQWEEIHPTISITSPQQILEFFQKKYPKMDIIQVDEPFLSKLFKTNKETKQFESGDKDASLILKFREVNKTHSTYLDPWINKVRHPLTGNIHPRIFQAFTATARLSYAQPNLQNITSNGYWKKIRHCIVSQKGFTLVDRDLSQFEVRALAEMAVEEKMMDFFRKAESMELDIQDYLLSYPKHSEEISRLIEKPNCSTEEIIEYLSKNSAIIKGKYAKLEELVLKLQACDFHTLNARALFKEAFDKGTPEARIELRKQAKVLTFAIPYGSGPTKIAETFKISKNDAKGLIDKYYKTWPNIAKYLDKCRRDSHVKGYTETPTGRKRFYNVPSYFSEEDQKRLRSGNERQATNHPIQSINGDVLKVASILMYPEITALGARIILWVHDEILVHCPDENVGKVSLIMDKCMKQAAIACKLTKCPIKTSLDINHSWSH